MPEKKSVKAAHSFKTKLAECRKIIVTEPADGSQAFILKILDRWDERGFEAEWAAIQKAIVARASPQDRAMIAAGERVPTSPYQLIEWVTGQAIAYERTVREFVPESKNREALVIAAAEQLRREAKKTSNPNLLRIAADRTAQAWEHRAKRTRILGRTGAPNPKRVFAVECRRMLRDTCGQPLDDVVATLTYVVTGKNVEMRDVLKPTTKAGRGHSR